MVCGFVRVFPGTIAASCVRMHVVWRKTVDPRPPTAAVESLKCHKSRRRLVLHERATYVPSEQRRENLRPERTRLLSEEIVQDSHRSIRPVQRGKPIKNGSVSDGGGRVLFSHYCWALAKYVKGNGTPSGTHTCLRISHTP